MVRHFKEHFKANVCIFLKELQHNLENYCQSYLIIISYKGQTWYEKKLTNADVTPCQPDGLTSCFCLFPINQRAAAETQSDLEWMIGSEEVWDSTDKGALRLMVDLGFWWGWLAPAGHYFDVPSTHVHVLADLFLMPSVTHKKLMASKKTYGDEWRSTVEDERSLDIGWRKDRVDPNS